MKNYDWIVVGSGITDSALNYKLVKKDFKVLLVDKEMNPANATSYNYGAWLTGRKPINYRVNFVTKALKFIVIYQEN